MFFWPVCDSKCDIRYHHALRSPAPLWFGGRALANDHAPLSPVLTQLFGRHQARFHGVPVQRHKVWSNWLRRAPAGRTERGLPVPAGQSWHNTGTTFKTTFPSRPHCLLQSSRGVLVVVCLKRESFFIFTWETFHMKNKPKTNTWEWI